VDAVVLGDKLGILSLHDVTYHPSIGPRMGNLGYELSERDTREHKSDLQGSHDYTAATRSAVLM
jgi:hypothetical protein